jgi:hypothetical protein
MVRASTTPVLAFLAVLISVLLAACASTGTGIPGDETYKGQLAAALAPPAGAAWLAADVQRKLLAGIEASGTFASVIALDSPRESNEAEIIILPTVLEARPGVRGPERLKLAVRTTRKSTGETGLNQVYEGRASGRGGAVADIIKPLNKDLKRRYGEPPVY